MPGAAAGQWRLIGESRVIGSEGTEQEHDQRSNFAWAKPE
jgi:hypothetical protein